MKAEKDTLMFVHGACHGSWCWKKYFVPFFESQGYKCHAIDLTDHETPGSSKNINHVPFTQYVDDLIKAVDKLDTLPVLIAHSMGGMVVQKYLETHPAKKVILMAAAPPHGVLGTTTRLFKFKGLVPSMLRRDILGGLKKNTRQAFFGPDLDETLLQEFQNNLCSESFKAYLLLLNPKVKINYHTQVPMLVMAAENDTLFTTKDAEKTARKYGADLKIMPDIAHDMMLDTGHDKVSAFIQTWLEKEA